MDEQLRKRLEEAREQGYKEAIALAKEWLEKNLNYVPMESFLAQFEADMKKLWEGKK